MNTCTLISTYHTFTLDFWQKKNKFIFFFKPNTYSKRVRRKEILVSNEVDGKLVNSERQGATFQVLRFSIFLFLFLRVRFVMRFQSYEQFGWIQVKNWWVQNWIRLNFLMGLGLEFWIELWFFFFFLKEGQEFVLFEGWVWRV